MTLTAVDFQPVGLGDTSVIWTVPGDQEWSLRSVCVRVTTGAGGTPNRSYLLQLTDGSNIVATIGAFDGTADPATGTVTWCNAPGAISTAGSVFVSNAPVPGVTLLPGYTVEAFVSHSQAGDAIDTAAVWYDYVLTSAGGV